jgi:hypothetical protein
MFKLASIRTQSDAVGLKLQKTYLMYNGQPNKITFGI